jgi:hypothetical protein
MAGRPSDLGPHHLERVTGIEPALSAWEQACHLALTIMFAGQKHFALSVSDPRVPPLILHSGTQRARCTPETIWLQNTPGLSVNVAHLGRSVQPIRWKRPVSGPVVVRLGGQPGTLDRRFGVKLRLTADLLACVNQIHAFRSHLAFFLRVSSPSFLLLRTARPTYEPRQFPPRQARPHSQLRVFRPCVRLVLDCDRNSMKGLPPELDAGA